MISFKALILSSVLIASLATVALAQPMSPMHGPHEHGHMGAPFANIDPSQLPETTGKVGQYLLNPRGDVDGLLLADGTEIHLPPQLGTVLVSAVRPGDSVSIRGLKARSAGMVLALSVTNTGSGVVVSQPGEPASRSVQGRVKASLHTPRGDLDGAVLEDGTMLRLPPPEATRFSALLTPGATIAVTGHGMTSPLGSVVMVQKIGASASALSEVRMPRFVEHHMGHGRPEAAPATP